MHSEANGHSIGAALIRERATTHGDYSANASTAQAIKQTLRNSPGWHDLSPRQRESLDLIATKISRIVSGNPNEPDHWNDISGYAELAGKGE